MINCPSCGAVNNETAINCVACGDLLKLICPQCTTQNTLNAVNCSQCGRLLVDKSDVRIKQQVFTESMQRAKPRKAQKGNPLIKPLVKVFTSAIVFIIINITKILAGHFIWQFLISLATGIITLWGLIEITFIIIEANEIIIEEPEIPQLPTKPALKISTPLESFESIEMASEAKLELSQGEAALGAISPEAEERGGAETLSTRHFEGLTDFLTSGIEEEIESVNKKIARTPKNHALLMRLAQLFEEKNELDKAIEVLERCVRLKPEVSEIYLYYGTLLRRADNPSGAKNALYRALEYNPTSSKAFYQLGSLEKSLNNLAEAKEMFQKSIRLSPDDPYAHYQLGMTYFELKDHRLAIMELKRATTLHPTDSYGHSRLGRLYQITNQLDLAIASYSRALSIKGNDAYVIEQLAEVLTIKGETQQAADFFQEALSKQFHPKTSTMVSLGKVLRKLERYSDLQNLMEEVTRLEPENADGKFLKAFALSKLGKQEEAKVILEQLAENLNAYYEVWLELGKIYNQEENNEKSVAAYVKATTTAPNQASIWNSIGVLLSNQKAYEEAVKAFRKAISFDYTDTKIATNLKAVQQKLAESCHRIIEARKEYLQNNPEDFEAYLDIGRSYEMLELPLEALESYKKLLEKEPQNVRGLLLYAELLTKSGQLKTAMRCYKEILKIEPENIDTHLYLVQANLNLGFINEALSHAKMVEKLAPENPMGRFLLGKVYLAKGLEPRALKEFTMVSNISSDPDMIAWSELMRRRLIKTEK
jgi:tetratricopeptide (TPR) repeat protein